MSARTAPPFCRACKFIVPDAEQGTEHAALSYARCANPEVREYDPVTGDERMPLCVVERSHPGTVHCSYEGINFVPKDAE